MLFVCCFLVFLGGGLDGIIYLLPIVLISLGIYTVISEFFLTEFDGWRIENDSISLLRNTLLGTLQYQTFDLKTIESILYVKAGNGPFSLTFKSKNKTYLLVPDMDIYEFSETLKFLKKQGVRINFFEKDYEIELFLNDKIDSIPMRNDMKIKTKANKN